MRKRSTRGRKPDVPMREYALGQTSDLLRRAAFQANRASVLTRAGAVHDLRVSIRRLTQCLRAFDQFLPQDGVRKVRRKLKMMLNLASQVRDRDVALDLLRRAALPSDSPLLEVLSEERTQAAQALVEESRLWAKKNIQKKWRSRLAF